MSGSAIGVRARRGAAWRVAALTLLLLTIGAFGVAWHGSGRTPGLGSGTLRSDQLGSARIVDALTRLERLGVVPDPGVFGDDPVAEPGVLAYARPGPRSGPLPSTDFARPHVSEGDEFDLVSVAIDPRDWGDDDRGIYANPFERGRRWERGACLSLFERGRLVAETTVGVRVHGDTSRKLADKSLRISLTERFGCRLASRDLLPGAVGQSLVLRNEVRPVVYASPIAYEVLDRLGVPVPKHRPVRVVVNGRLLDSVYSLTEHLDDSHVRARLGHDRFLRVDFKGPKPKPYRNDLLLLRNRRPALLADAADMFDPDALLAWLTGVLYCSVYDARQGIAYRDLRAGGPWRCVAWDLDWAFGDWPQRVSGRAVATADVVENLDDPIEDLRTAAFHHFMRDDPAFRDALLARVADAINHRLSPRWCAAVLARYRDVAGVYGGRRRARFEASLDRVERFFADRPASLCAELSRRFDLGPLHRVEVRVAPGLGVRVDGHVYRGGWSGRYFDGQTCRIAPVGVAAARVLVDGEQAGSAGGVAVQVRRDLDVAIVPR